MNIIIVIPAYNESHTIAAVIAGCKKLIDEVIVVDDGSTDGTARIAKRAGARVFCHLVNRGYGAALKTGIVAALQRGADIIVTIDADQQHNPAEIPNLVLPLTQEETQEKVDIVIGDRFGVASRRDGMSIWRAFLIACGNLLTWLLYGVWLRDTQSGFRAYRRTVYERLAVEADGMEFSSAIIGEAARQGMRIALVPITVRYTDYSLAKGQNAMTGIKTALRLFMRRILG